MNIPDSVIAELTYLSKLELNMTDVAGWGFVRMTPETADEVLACIELSEFVERLFEKYGEERGFKMMMIYIKLLAIPSTIETLNILEKSHDS